MSWLRRLFTREQLEVELDKELRFHFDLQVAEKMRNGMSESQARRIGANTAVFSVVDTVLLKPLTYPEHGRIVQFLHTAPNDSSIVASAVDFNLWRSQTSVVQDVAAYQYREHGFNLTGAVQEQMPGLRVSEACFRLFGAHALLGRTLHATGRQPHGRRFNKCQALLSPGDNRPGWLSSLTVRQ